MNPHNLKMDDVKVVRRLAIISFNILECLWSYIVLPVKIKAIWGKRKGNTHLDNTFGRNMQNGGNDKERGAETREDQNWERKVGG